MNILPEQKEQNAHNTGGKPEVLAVIGLSGAGKSTVLQVLEDLHFFTADGLPPSLISQFFHLFQAPSMEHFRGLALGIDLRRGGTYAELTQALNRLRSKGAHPSLFFLEAQQDVILRRYATTRRPHPLEREGLSLEQAMGEECRRLAPIRDAADFVLDTSPFSPHDLRREIQRRWLSSRTISSAMRVNLISFGFKYGVPSEAELVFDLRFLPNPYFVEELRPLSGLDEAVRDHIFAQEPAQRFRDQFLDFLRFLLPCYDQEGRYRLCIALGCTGGRHRSVAMTEITAHALRQAGYSVLVEHRHWNLG